MSEHFIWNCQEERNGLKGRAVLKIQEKQAKITAWSIFLKCEIYTSFFKENKAELLYEDIYEDYLHE